ncbi:MAG TPA: hypothetical protein VIG25_14115 [Pyrinomonadaceae bacterium]|jgi:hypothetical protein
MKPNSFSANVALKNGIALFVIVLCSWTSVLSKSHLYASGYDENQNSELYRINVNTGAAKALGVTGQADLISESGLAFDTHHRILYATGFTLTNPLPNGNPRSALYTLDVKTGLASLVGNGQPVFPEIILWGGGLAYDSNHDVLFATGISSFGFVVRDSLFIVNPSTGIAREIGPSSNGPPEYDLSGGDLAYDPVNDVLYATGFANVEGPSALFIVNPETGEALPVGYQEPDAFLGFGGLEFDPSTGLLYATGYDRTKPFAETFLYVVDPTTGSAKKIGRTGNGVQLFGGLALVPPGKAD